MLLHLVQRLVLNQVAVLVELQPEEVEVLDRFHNPLVVAIVSDCLQDLHEIEQTRTLKLGLAAEIDRVAQENLLDAFRLADELAAYGEEGRHRAGNVRSGHAGAAQLAIQGRPAVAGESLGFDAGRA